MAAICSSVIVRKAHDSAALCICSSRSARSLVTRALIFSNKSRALKVSRFSHKIARVTEGSCSLGGDRTELEPSPSRSIEPNSTVTATSRGNCDGDTSESIGILKTKAREQMIERLKPQKINSRPLQIKIKS